MLTRSCTHTEEDPLWTEQNDPGEKEHARPSLNEDILCCCRCPEAPQFRFCRHWTQTQQPLLALRSSAWDWSHITCPTYSESSKFLKNVPGSLTPRPLWDYLASDSQVIVGLSSLWPCEPIYWIFLIIAQINSIGWIPLKTPKLNAHVQWIPLNIYGSLSWFSPYYRWVQDAYKWFWVIWLITMK